MKDLAAETDERRGHLDLVRTPARELHTLRRGVADPQVVFAGNGEGTGLGAGCTAERSLSGANSGFIPGGLAADGTVVSAAALMEFGFEPVLSNGDYDSCVIELEARD